MKKKIVIFKKQREYIKNCIDSLIFRNEARKNNADFTRDRSMNFKNLCLFILKGIKTSLQLELDDFYEEDIAEEGLESVSKQAFSQARTNLKPEAFQGIFKHNARTMSDVKDLDFYKDKYRLVAIDGSKTKLYNSEELREEFGTASGSEKAASFLNSMAYDPLNNTILDASPNHVNASERECAKAHIEAISKMPLKRGIKNLYLCDRGYPSVDYLSFLLDGKHNFILRVREKFSLEYDAVKKDDTDLRLKTRQNRLVRLRKSV